MNNLDSPHAKLLYLISDLFVQKEITEHERTILKELVINEDESIFDTLKAYESTPDDGLLRRSIIDLVKSKDEKVGIDLDPQKKFEPPEQDDVSSPLGNSLFERKKRHTHSSELSGLAEALRPADHKA